MDEWFSKAGQDTLQTLQTVVRTSKALGRLDALFKIVKDLAHLPEHPELLIPIYREAVAAAVAGSEAAGRRVST